jgi:uncharacterized membrane protein
MNKKKQTMIYPFLLPMNVVDTMFHVAGLYEAMVFRDGCVQRLSGKHESLAAASFFFLLRSSVGFYRQLGGVVFFLSLPLFISAGAACMP